MTRTARSVLPALLVLLGTAPAVSAAAPSAVTPAGANAATPATAGTPWTWGGNGFGQLGDGTTTARRTPGPVAGLTDVVDLHGGREHVAALRSDGTVWVWGSNDEGQLGLGTITGRSTPTQVPGLPAATAVETGHNLSLALLADGTVRTWGLNADGQLGDGTTTLRRSPVTVSGLTDAVALAAGRNMSYALRADGTVWAWGRNDEGQLGDGTTTRRTTPVRVAGLTEVVRIAGGRDHGLAVRADGTVWTWGSNDYGQIGDGTTTDRTTPVQVLGGATSVIAGAHHSYALRADGTVAAWGRNYRSNLGDGTTVQRSRPVTVRGLAGVVSVGSGRDTGMAVLADGRLMGWGRNAAGQVGDGTTTDRSVPVLVPGVEDAVLAGGGGEEYAVALVAPSTAEPQDPSASFTATCTALSCRFDASASSDPDGTIAGYAWDLDGVPAQGAVVDHAFTSAGSYPVTLTVTDDSGASASLSRQVEVADAPVVVAPTYRASAAVDVSTSRPAVVVPSSVQGTDRLVLVVSTARAATLATPAGWSLAGTVSDGTEVRSWVLTRSAAGLAGTTVRLALDATAKTSLTLLAYAGAAAPSAVVGRAETGTSRTHTAPAAGVVADGSLVLRYYVDKGSTAHGWALDAGLAPRTATAGVGGGMLTSASGDHGPVTAGTVPPLSADAGVSSSKAVAWTVVLPPT